PLRSIASSSTAAHHICACSRRTASPLLKLVLSTHTATGSATCLESSLRKKPSSKTGDQHANSPTWCDRICRRGPAVGSPQPWSRGDGHRPPSGKARGTGKSRSQSRRRLRHASLIAGHDALISAFNPGWTPGTQRPEMYAREVRGTSSIVRAAKKAGIKRVLWVGGAGGLEVASGVKVIDSPDFPEWIKP